MIPMVLPEGVLNNKNLQSVREYFEGRAKLLLICSIPQDVFIAAGATVKPSLVFMKKFTEEEELEYKKAYEAAIAETIDKYDKEYKEINNIVEKCKKNNEELNDILNNKISKSDVSKIKKQIRENIKLLNENEKKFKKLQEAIELEAKPLVKSKFNYDIPIAKVTDAGITTTGAKSEGNELPKLLEEYTKYRKKNKLWISEELKYSYKISKNSFIRMIGDVEDLELDV